MAFWGIEVKPGKPYTHSSKTGSGRLRISQATLADGSAPKKSLVQCNVGDKRPVLLCALLPDKTESLQLDLEFEEAEDVMFSVIGPRGVYLTGYFVSHNRQSNMQDESESFGEDIANSETQESNRCSDEDEYEDSFINDDEPEPLTPSPTSSFTDDDEYQKKKRNEKGGRKRLIKKYQVIESDDEDYMPISSICKNKKLEESEKKTKKETASESDNEAKNNGSKVDVHIVDDETEGEVEEAKNKSKSKKKRHEQNGANANEGSNMPPQSPLSEVKTKKKKNKKENSDKTEHQKQPTDTGVSSSLEVLTSAEKKLKPKKKRKGRNADEDDQQENDKKSNESEEKKVKKKKRKTKMETEIEEENKIEENNENKKTLSNGLVIEELVKGNNSKGKVAAAGKKVKVQYVVKLKENGQIIDSNGKSPHKFRLGDKEVIEGLNVGLDGMRVGDKRRVTIPPSMSVGYKGTGENVPPNSWLVYDVEMTSIH